MVYRVSLCRLPSRCHSPVTESISHLSLILAFFLLDRFGRMALQILALVDAIPFHAGHMREQTELQPEQSIGEAVWPPLKPDHFLSVSMTKARKVEPSSVEMHTIIICAMLFSNDTGVLSECIPGLTMSFQDNSIFNATTNPPTRDSRQEEFLLSAVVDFAQNFDSGPIDSFACLQELNVLATRWAFDQAWLQTSFLIAMYELGKDTVVDDLMTAAVSHVLPSQLIVGGVNIVCRRLDFFLSRAKSKGEARNILGLLDAELCDWIHQRSKFSQPLVTSFAYEVGLGKWFLYIVDDQGSFLMICSQKSLVFFKQPRLKS